MTHLPGSSSGIPSAPNAPRVWTVFAALPITLGAIFALSLATMVGVALVKLLTDRTLASISLLGAFIDRFVHSAFGVSVMVAVSAITMTSAAIVAAELSPTPWRQRLRLDRSRLGTLDIVLTCMSLIALSTCCGALIQASGLGNQGTIAMMNKAFSGMSPFMTAVTVVCVGAMPGIGEELFFRGYIQSRLELRWGPAVAIVISAITFGVYHLDPMQGLFAVVAGLFLGFVASRARSIRPTMIAHASSNAFSVISASLNPAGTHQDDPRSEILAQALIAGVIAVVLIGILTYRIRGKGRDEGDAI